MGLDKRAGIGRRIRNLRIDRGMSQAMLADKSGINRINLNRPEKGKADPMFATLRRIAKALGVTLTELVRGLDLD